MALRRPELTQLRAVTPAPSSATSSDGASWFFQAVSLAHILLQSLQLCAFAILATTDPHHPLRVAAAAILLNAFDWFMPCFFVSVGFVVAWYITISMPVVVEELMQWKPRDTIAAYSWWPACAGLFGSTLYPVTVFSLLKPLGCMRVDSPGTVLAGTSVQC